MVSASGGYYKPTYAHSAQAWRSKMMGVHEHAHLIPVHMH